MKAFVAFGVILILAVGGIGGYFFWERMNKVEPRGVGLTMSNPVSKGEIDFLTKQYNEILDREEVLIGAVEKHNLAKFYGVSSSEEALELFRKDSYVSLPGETNLHILFMGKRSTRSERDSTARTLAEDFLKAAKIAGGN